MLGFGHGNHRKFWEWPSACQYTSTYWKVTKMHCASTKINLHFCKSNVFGLFAAYVFVTLTCYQVNNWYNRPINAAPSEKSGNHEIIQLCSILLHDGCVECILIYAAVICWLCREFANVILREILRRKFLKTFRGGRGRGGPHLICSIL